MSSSLDQSALSLTKWPVEGECVALLCPLKVEASGKQCESLFVHHLDNIPQKSVTILDYSVRKNKLSRT